MSFGMGMDYSNPVRVRVPIKSNHSSAFFHLKVSKSFLGYFSLNNFSVWNQMAWSVNNQVGHSHSLHSGWLPHTWLITTSNGHCCLLLQDFTRTLISHTCTPLFFLFFLQQQQQRSNGNENEIAKKKTENPKVSSCPQTLMESDEGPIEN